MLDKKKIDNQLSLIKKLKQMTKDRIKKDKEFIKSLSSERIPNFEVLKKIYKENFTNPIHIKEQTEELYEGDKKVEYLKLRDEYSDEGFFESIKNLLDDLPESNGSKFYPKMNVNIGIIADEFLFNSFKDMANFHYITKDNYKEYVGRLDIFLIVSTWHGLNSEWKGVGNSKNKLREELYNIINFYKQNNVKTAFYSKEDPVNYDIFIDIAKKCDYIFTTAEEIMGDYKADCNNENVNVLNFGINPCYHNPIGFRNFPKSKEVLFSGSWYNKYPERIVDTKMIFNGVLDSGKDLKIIDRNFSLNNPRYFFPKEYLKYISPAVDHSYLQKLHKLFDWSINLNTVKDSQTMFANRIYELQALGNLLLSNYSIGVNSLFPNVFLINNQEEVKSILNTYTDEDIYRQQVFGIRKVMTNHTTYQRIEELLDIVGLSYQKLERKVVVVVKQKSDQVTKIFNYQTYPYKELVLENELSDETLKAYDMVTFFDEDKYYGEFYLEDMINGFKYTNSDYITKDAYYDGENYISGIEHNYVTTMKDKCRTVFWCDAFTVEELLNFKEPVAINGYSIDPFEFNNETIMAKESETSTYNVSVIVPIYNNGDHLLNKCFNSLRRSSIFNQMEIILVDDGSTDNYTDKVVKRLEKDYPNVKAYLFGDGGSGSASRPRNKGFELSTSKYIAYLDPDNEAINDGYSVLYDEISSNKYDLVIGNMIKIDDQVNKFNYYKSAIKILNTSVVSKSEIKKLLIKSNFKSQSTQALIINRDMIENSSLKMVEGAIGEDTLFFYELLLNSNNVKVIDYDIHIYYAAVSGSSVNNISKSFFEKYYKLEKVKIPTLKEYDVFNDYLSRKFEYYFKNWYLKKLKNTKKEEVVDSIQVLSNILELYKNEVRFSDSSLKRFANLCKSKNYQAIISEFIED